LHALAVSHADEVAGVILDAVLTATAVATGAR
jgi:hypothetical protein